MDQRLQQLLLAENISQSQFADKIGVARASVSHILSGRNKPGFDFIENLSRAYPTVNLEWIITGKGKMYKERNLPHIPEEDSPSLFGPETATPLPEPDPAPELAPTPAPAPAFQSSTPSTSTSNSARTIVKIIAFYSDGTFQELK